MTIERLDAIEAKYYCEYDYDPYFYVKDRYADPHHEVEKFVNSREI